MPFGLDTLLDAITSGGYNTRAKKRNENRQIQEDLVNKLTQERALNIPQGSSLQEMGRGMDLQARGVQPQTQGPMMPQFMQPQQSQFPPNFMGPQPPQMGQNTPQMPQGAVFPQPAIGGQGPTNLPMTAGQNPQDTRAMNLHQLWQQQYQGQAQTAQQGAAAGVKTQQLHNQLLQSALNSGGQPTIQMVPGPNGMQVPFYTMPNAQGMPVTKPLPASAGASQIARGSPEWNTALQAVWSGRAMPDDYLRGMGQATNRFNFMTDLMSKNQSFQMNPAVSKRHQAASYGGYMGRQGSRLASAAQSVGKNMPRLVSLVNQLGDDGIQNVAGYVRGAEKQLNSNAANELYTLLKATAFEEAVVENGGYDPTTTAQEAMLKVFAEGLGSQGIEGVQNAITRVNYNRVTSLQNPWETPENPDSQAVQWAKSNPKDPRSKKILQLNGL